MSKRMFVVCTICLSLLACQDSTEPDARSWAERFEESSTPRDTKSPASSQTPADSTEGDPRSPTERESTKIDPGEVDPGEEPAPREDRFVVHEWGTFTSMQGSDGLVLQGLHHEEEPLPGFVHARSITGVGFIKGMEFLPEQGANQKLETPVIYFYGGKQKQVSVEVDFPKGILSQWYPAASSFAPELKGVGQLDTLTDGAMRWDVELLDRAPKMIPVPEDDIWAPSRQVDARGLKVGQEEENLIFYRGLGNFSTPLTVRSSAGDRVTIKNNSADRIGRVIALHFNGEKGAVWDLGPLEGDASLEFTPSPKELPKEQYLQLVRGVLGKALVESGLYHKEAQAMINTWNKSYFHTPGLRVLYIVPRPWTDALLPLRIEPQPDEVVRTLVGRVEVLLHSEEQQLLQQVRATQSEGANSLHLLDAMGRFAEPRLRRVKALLGDNEREEIGPLLDAMIQSTRCRQSLGVYCK